MYSAAFECSARTAGHSTEKVPTWAFASPTDDPRRQRQDSPSMPHGPKLLTQLKRALRARRYSPRTEEAYCSWVRQFVQFHDLRHPHRLGVDEVDAFLAHLAVERGVSSSTQGQARAALMFLYNEVLRLPLEAGAKGRTVLTGRIPQRLPTVLSRGEATRVLRRIRGSKRLIASLLYGSGLRLGEALELRVKDVDIERRELRVRVAKGGNARVTVLPDTLVRPLQGQLDRRKALHDRDLAEGCGWVRLPDQFHKKSPRAAM
jgi:integrase